MATLLMCRTCEVPKATDQFYKSRHGTLERQCKGCKNAYARERMRSNPDARERKRQSYLRNTNPERRRAYNLKAMYGLSLEQYEAMMVAQDRTCVACEERFGAGRDAVHVDHDHATGVVRALLCGPCNRALGHAKESPSRLRALARYIEGRL